METVDTELIIIIIIELQKNVKFRLISHRRYKNIVEISFIVQEKDDSDVIKKNNYAFFRKICVTVDIIIFFVSIPRIHNYMSGRICGNSYNYKLLYFLF